MNVPVNVTPVKKSSSSPSSSGNRKATPRKSTNTPSNQQKKIRKSDLIKESVAKESEQIQKTESFISHAFDIKKETDLFLEMERLHINLQTYQDPWIIYNFNEQQKKNLEVQSSTQSIDQEYEKSNSSSEERISSLIYSSTSSPTVDTSDDDFNETRNDIKKLRESLANQRERFFYGDSYQQSVSNTSEFNVTEECFSFFI